MKHFTHSTKLYFFGIIISVSLLTASASSQTRAIGAGALVLDDGLGQTITLQTPNGGWMGNIPFVIPIPPAGNPPSGFVYTGTAAGQILQWVAPNTTGPAPNNYPGGVQGSWQPVPITSIGALTGIGTAGMIPIWTGTSTQGNSALAQNYNNSVAPYDATSSGEQLLATDAAATDISIALEPKGAGALEAQLADNTTTGGNLRGTNAVDWQMGRGLNTQVASGDGATVSGGTSNTASYFYATVSGGNTNTAYGYSATVSGGYSNNAVGGNYATVSGGASNTASGGSATVSGGADNTASNEFATVSGGFSDTASANSSTVSGGVVNIASGDYSAIPGGEHLTLSGYDDFGFLGLNDGVGNAMSIAENNTSVFGNTDLWLANNDNTARALYFYAPYNTGGAFPNGDNYVGFQAGVVTTSVIWTLPLADGTANQVLQTNGSGALSWATPGGGGSIVTVSSSTTVGTGVSEVVCSGTSNITVTLPAASSYASGTEIDFIWAGDGTHTATIQPGGIDALVLGTDATATIQTDAAGWNSLGVKSNGTNTWYYCHQ